MRTIIVLLLAVVAISGQKRRYDGYKVLSILPEENDQVISLQKYPKDGIDFWNSFNKVNNNVSVMVAPEQIYQFQHFLNELNLKYTPVIDNVQSVLDREYLEQLRHRSLKSHNKISFNKYERFDDINAYLRELAKKNPAQVQTQTIGKSYEGRELLVIKISNGDGRQKPIVFIDGGIHAREWIAPSTVLYFINQLAENPANSHMVENVDWYILPCANPDGYEYSHTRDRFWRKTRSRQGSYYGVDPNRNFGYKWATVGSSNQPSSDIYHGPSAFSELETRAIRDFLLSKKGHTKLYLTFHSYGNYVLYPWGWTSDLPDDWRELDGLGKQAAEAIRSVRGTRYTVGSSTNVLYAAAGGSDDWAKAVAGVALSFTLELPGGGSSGFDPPPSMIKIIAEETWEGIKTYHEYIEENF